MEQGSWRWGILGAGAAANGMAAALQGKLTPELESHPHMQMLKNLIEKSREKERAASDASAPDLNTVMRTSAREMEKAV